jgi:hypothetical protein
MNPARVSIHLAGAALVLAATAGAAVTQADVTLQSVGPGMIDLRDRCVRATAQMVPPKVTSFGGAPPSAYVQGAPSSKFAILGLEVTDFDPAMPPEIWIFDDTDGPAAAPKEKIIFAAATAAPCPALTKLTVPVFQAYDEKPFQRPDKEPRATLTRVEVHHPKLLIQPTVAFSRMEKGVFVVPVYWHNIAEEAVGKAHVDPKQVMELFWSIPKDPVYGSADDVNSIWSQAKIQFRLMNDAIPFRLSDIPTHVVPAPQKSRVDHCKKGWTADYNNKAAVDIYGLYALGGNSDPEGIGNCRAEGYVLIRADDPATLRPGFSSPVNNAAGRAILVAHEFGHFLASLPHKDDSLNLMHSMLGSATLEPAQGDLARQRIKNFGTFNADR